MRKSKFTEEQRGRGGRQAERGVPSAGSERTDAVPLESEIWRPGCERGLVAELMLDVKGLRLVLSKQF